MSCRVQKMKKLFLFLLFFAAGISFAESQIALRQRFFAAVQKDPAAAVKFLEDKDSEIRRYALYLVIKKNPAAALEILGRMSRDPDSFVRMTAVSALPELAKKHLVIVEYGIESCYDQTLVRINRGHDFETARRAVQMTADRGIDVGVHFILGLPGETRQMMLDACDMINSLPIRSVKFHQLQIVKGTQMEKEYAQVPQDFERFSLEEYLDFFVEMLERLRPDLFIERFVGEVPPRFVNETPWGLIRNVELLRLLEARLLEKDSWQGKLLEK